MAKARWCTGVRTVGRRHRRGWAMLGVRGLEHACRGARRVPVGPTGRPRPHGAVPIGDVDLDASPTRLDRRRRARPRARRRAVPGAVMLLGGEPGIGKCTLLMQVSAASPARGRGALRDGRGVGPRCGCGPSGSMRATAFSARRPSCAEASRRRSTSPAGARGRRLDPDDARARAARRPARWPSCARRPPGCREAKRRDRAVSSSATSPRTVARRPEGARTPGRHGALVRGRHHHAYGCCGPEEPLRPDPRARRVRDGREEGFAGCPTRAGCSSPTGGPGPAGSVVVPTVEGSRPLLVEVQALVAVSGLPRRVVGRPRQQPSGAAAGGATAQCLALAGRPRRLRARRGGVRIVEPAADLAVALASPRRSPTGRSTPTSWRAARSASAVSCARWPTRPPSGRGAPAGFTASCCRCRPRSRPRAWRRSAWAPSPGARRRRPAHVLRRFERLRRSGRRGAGRDSVRPPATTERPLAATGVAGVPPTAATGRSTSVPRGEPG